MSVADKSAIMIIVLIILGAIIGGISGGKNGIVLGSGFGFMVGIIFMPMLFGFWD